MAKQSNKPLDDRQLAFCREYIVDFNQTKSAIRAGYAERSARQTASRLMTNDNILAEIKRLVEERAKRTEITADAVVKQLAKIAFLDMRDVVDWGVEEREKWIDEEDEKGKEHRKLHKYLVEYVRPKQSSEVDGTLIQSVKKGKMGFEITVPDKMKAMEMLAKHLGVYDERPQTTVDVGSYVNALWERVGNGDLWADFDNGGPDPGDDDDGEE